MSTLKIRFIILPVIVIIAVACIQNKKTTSTLATSARNETQGKLIFQSGFEGSSTVERYGDPKDHGTYYERIVGLDKEQTPKGDWDMDLKDFLNNGIMQVQYTGGDSTKRFAKIIIEPANPKNKVLYYWLNGSWLASEGQTKARIQTNLYGIKGGTKDLYQSVRVFLTEDFNVLKNYPDQITWCTIAEFWNNEWWPPTLANGFRITVGIGKNRGISNGMHFILEAENAGQKLVWRADPTSSNIMVPIGKWFTLHYYFKEGNKETGRFYMAITTEGQPTQVVYDVHDFTHGTNDPAPDGLTSYNPMKLYTSKEVIAFVHAQNKTLQVYWDDFKLWKDKKPD